MSLELLTHLLDLPHVVVIGYELPDAETVRLDVEIRLPAATCPHCGHPSMHIHSYGVPRMVRDLDVWDRRCYLRFRPRQFRCDHCQRTFVERLLWVIPGQHQTVRMEARVCELTQCTNVAEAARYWAMTDEQVSGFFLRTAQAWADARGYPQVTTLHVDEIAPHKGHGNYCLVISAPDVGVLDVLEDRHKETLEAWLDARGPAWCAAVTAFHADMWRPYHEAARAKLPNVPVTTADHFHVIQNLNDVLGEVRKAVQRTADDTTRAALKGCRWLLVKDPRDLSESDQERLEAALQAAPQLRRAYELKEDFRAIYALRDTATAAQQLTAWLERASTDGHALFKSFINTVTNWRHEILRFFHGRGSNGFAEGVNNKIKLILRRAFGCANFAHLRLRILVACCR
jgi:transposase